MIPYGRQNINDSDINAVINVLKSDYLTQGPVVPKFEKAIAEKVNVKRAVAVNSATAALHIAALSLGLSKGDILWTTPITFVASANCALYCGATVDFVDIDPQTYNMSAAALEIKLRHAYEAGKLPKIIVPVHMGGQSPDMEKIQALANLYGVKIIEDASHAIGAEYKGKPVGSCFHSDITIFSFHPVKIITTAEGGVATTCDDILADKMKLLRSHGITRDTVLMDEPSHGPWYYQQLELGFNYRMTEMQAALGCTQLTRLEEFVDRRNELAEIYDTLLEQLPVSQPKRDLDARSSFHLYIVRLLSKNSGIHRQVFEELRAAGIGVNVHYIPVHLQPFYRAMGFKNGDFPEAENYYKQAISLPLYPAMSMSDLNQVVCSLEQSLKKHNC